MIRVLALAVSYVLVFLAGAVVGIRLNAAGR